MRSVSLFLPIVLILTNVALSRDAVKITDATSPDGKYTISASMEGETTCRVEFRGKSGKTVGKCIVSDYDVSDHRSSISAVWKADTSAVGLNINHGPSITDCIILANHNGSWAELPIPKEPIEKVRKAGNTHGGKAVDYLTVQSWLPDQNFKISYTGNNGAEYALIFHLARGWKSHLEHLQTIAPKSALTDPKATSELPCAFHVFAGGTEGSTDGPSDSAQFKNPSGLAVDATGNIYVADRTNDTLRRITSAGVTETLAGSVGEPGSADGAGKTARFWYPQGLAIDGSGNIYVADTSSKCVRKVTPAGEVSTLATGFKYPTAVAADREGNVYVTDSSNYVVEKIARDGTMSVVAGKSGEAGMKNGRGEEARFRFPNGVAVSSDGTLFVVDRSVVRKVDGKGNVTTFAGSLEEEGRTDGTGGAARFWGLTSIAVDVRGNLYVADQELKNLRRISKEGVVQTLRTGEHGDLPLQNPVALAVDAQGHIYVADQNASTILLVEPAGARDVLAK